MIGQEVQAPKDLVVMNRPPVFSTRDGWVSGFRIAKVPSGTKVQILEERTVGFFGSTQKWLLIRWDNREGWVNGDDLLRQSQVDPAPCFPVVSLVSVAYAGNQGGPSSGLPAPPPLYLYSFCAILVGIVAKILYDIFNLEPDRPLSLKALKDSGKFFLRKLLPPLLISPIIFLFFIRTADFQIQDTWSMYVFLLFAFQNGFFWQDVLTKRVSPTPKPAPSKA